MTTSPLWILAVGMVLLQSKTVPLTGVAISTQPGIPAAVKLLKVVR